MGCCGCGSCGNQNKERKMGCGCGKNKNNALRARKPGRSVSISPKNRAVNNMKSPPRGKHVNPVLEEKRAQERLRRETLLKALRRP